MIRKVWVGVAMFATGITLLVVAGFAAGATSGTSKTHGKTGLAMNLDMSNSDFDYLDPALAWTGVKDSGRGCTLSRLGLETFTRPKSFHLRLSLQGG